MTAELQVIPAVDLLGEEAVRLDQGRYDRIALRAGDPRELVRRFAAAGAPLVHVVDLDGARAGAIRPDVVAALAETAAPARLQVSGGIRSLADARALLAAGAARVVLGTAAWAARDALPALVAELGDRLVVAIDVRDDTVAVRGWLDATALSAEEAASRCAEAGVARILCTAIERDGTLSGPDLDLLARVKEASRLPVLAAGGIRDQADLDALAALGCEGAIVGRALLEGRVSLGRTTTAA